VRLTPAQGGMAMLLGEWLPMGMPVEWTVAERIRRGREYLVELAKEDFGYDLHAWHDYLRATNAGGYRWSNGHLGMPRRIEAALASAEWRAAVAGLEGERTTE
jgi:hypothetical protein